MYKSIEINNYRGIKHANIDGFSNVNLFFGKNNCGKSSILESLFLISGQSNPNLAFRANFLRGLGQYSKMSVEVDFYRVSKENEINIKTEGDESRELHIRAIESDSHEVLPDSPIDGQQRYFGLLAKHKLNGTSYNSRIVVSEDKTGAARLQIDKRYRESLKCRILGSAFIQTADINSAYTDLVTKKQEHEIIDVLKIVEPNLHDIQLVGENFMVDVGLPSRLPLNVLGDGFRKIFSIILAMHECSNGILLIDEMDNGLHFSVMSKLWRAIFEESQKNNVQLFVTTHSLDLLNGLKECVENDSRYQDHVSAFKVNKSKDDMVSTLKYTYPMIEFGLTQEIEMR